MNSKILFVDDEENILLAYTRSLRKRFQLDTAIGGKEALYRLKHDGPYAVLITDMRMPGMDGVQLLEEVRLLYPDTVRMMLTGNSDQQTATDAVNKGAIFRFLSKPCETEDLALALKAALEQHRLLTVEKDLLERTLKGAILMLGELLSMLDPASFGRSQQVADLAKQIANEMEMDNAWMMEVAAILAHIGIHTLPPTVLAKMQSGAFLSGVEREMCHSIPETGANLIRCIPRLDDVASIVYYAQKNFNGTGFPLDDVKGDLIPEGARILRVASDFVTLMVQKGSSGAAIQDMATRLAWYDPKVVQTLRGLITRTEDIDDQLPVRSVAFGELQVGQRLAENVETLGDWMVLPRNTVIGRTHLEKMRNFQRLGGLKEPMFIFDE
ncbi:MAG: response regulator [Holophaga sp.]|nr:response regulator [Holophaga sp.]